MSGITFVGDEIDVTKYQGTMDLIYETKTGFITAGAISDSEWLGMCTVLNRPDWVDDDRFATTTARFRNAEERKQLTGAEIMKWERDELLERFDAEGVPSAPLLTRLELLDDLQIHENHTIEIYEFEEHGKIRQARPAAIFEGTPSEVKSPAPHLGEHSSEVLESVGLSTAEVKALAEAGSVT